MDVIKPPVTAEPTGEVTPEAQTQGQDPETTKRLAILSRREQALREQEKALKLEIEAEKGRMLQELSQKRKELEPYERWREVEGKLRSKDYSVLKELGVDYNEYTQQVLSDGQKSPQAMMELMKEDILKAIDEKIQSKEQEFSKKSEEMTKGYQEQLAKEQRMDIKEFLSKEEVSSKHPWLTMQDSPEDLVFAVIQNYLAESQEKTGRARMLSHEEASEKAEQYLVDEAKKRFKDRSRGKGLLEQLFGPEEPAAPAPKAPQSPNTLTQNTVTPPTIREVGKVDLDKSKEAAARLLKWS